MLVTGMSTQATREKEARMSTTTRPPPSPTPCLPSGWSFVLGVLLVIAGVARLAVALASSKPAPAAAA